MNFRRIMALEIHFGPNSNNPVMKSLADCYLESEEVISAHARNGCGTKPIERIIAQSGSSACPEFDVAGALVGMVAAVKFSKVTNLRKEMIYCWLPAFFLRCWALTGNRLRTIVQNKGRDSKNA